MSAHTPGPWCVIRLQTSDVVVGAPTMEADDLEGGDKFVVSRVCRLYRSAVNPRHQTDANLIAAAPELLTALKAMVAAYDGIDDMLGPSMKAKIAAARAAIAKAEGRS